MYSHLNRELSRAIDHVRLESIIAAIILSAVVIILAPRFDLVPEVHTELTAGYLTWTARSKTADYIVPIVISIIVLTVMLGAGWIRSLVAQTWGETTAERLLSLTLITSLPGIAGIAAWVTNAGGKDLIVFSAILIGVLALAVWSMIIRRAALGGRDVGELWAGSVIAFLLGAFAPIALAIAAGRLWILSISATALIVSVISCALACLLLFLLLQMAATPRTSLAASLLSAIQIPASLGFLLLIPPVLALPDGTLLTQATSAQLWTVLACGIAVAWWSIASRRFRTSGDKDLLAVVSPWTLVAVLIVFRFRTWQVPSVSADDYSLGEYLTPAWMTMTYGAVPYVDITPAHGLFDYIGQTVSVLFYDGSAAFLSFAHNTAANVLFLPILFLVLRWIAGTWISFALCAIFPFYYPMYIEVSLIVLIICAQHEGLRSYWLPLWITVGTIAVLLMAGLGVVLAAASIPLGSYIAFCVFKEDWRRAIPGFALLAISALVLLLTPLPAMIWGAVRYVLENGSINTIAYGLPWELSRSVVPFGPNGGALFEILRSSWIAVPILLSIAVIVVYARNYSSKVRFEVSAAASMGGLFLLLLIPYTMGRIDPGSTSRIGLFSALAWAGLIPLVLFPLGATLFKIRVLSVVVFICCSIYPPTLSSLPAATRPILPAPAPTDGQSIGMPQLGRALMDPSHLDRLRRLKTVLDGLLPEGQPYLDLTGRSAHYFYMARPQPIEIGAPYNIVPLAQQRRAVERLSAKPPAIALLEAQNIIHEGRSVAIRSHELYRFAVQNYVPVTISGFILGVHKDRRDLLAAVNESLFPTSLTDVNWDRGISRGRAGFFVSQPHLVRGLRLGDIVTFVGSGDRRIEKIEGVNVWVDGPALDPMRDGFPNQIRFLVSEQRRAEWRLALFDQAFRVAQLDFLPNSWGSSLRALSGKIEPVAPPLGDPVHFNNMRRDADGGFTVLGPDPYVVFDISGLHLSGSQAGLLNLRFACMGQQGQPVIEVYFAAAGEVPTEDTVVRATVQDGDLLIPLDSQPRWLLANQLSLLRLDLADHHTCSRVRFDGVQLWNRKAF